MIFAISRSDVCTISSDPTVKNGLYLLLFIINQKLISMLCLFQSAYFQIADHEF